MTKDLEITIAELNAEKTMNFLRAHAELSPRKNLMTRAHKARRNTLCLRFIAVFICVGFLSIFYPMFFNAKISAPKIYTLAYDSSNDAINTILATQQSDGSWESDFITQQNATALAQSLNPNAKQAYRRAVRYLRSRSLTPLSENEFLKRYKNHKSV